MYNWFLTGGVEVDWAIGLSALAFLLAAAVLTGYIYGFDDGYGRTKWCNYCKTYHSNRESCFEDKGI